MCVNIQHCVLCLCICSRLFCLCVTWFQWIHSVSAAAHWVTVSAALSPSWSAVNLSEVSGGRKPWREQEKDGAIELLSAAERWASLSCGSPGSAHVSKTRAQLQRLQRLWLHCVCLRAWAHVLCLLADWNIQQELFDISDSISSRLTTRTAGS